MTHTDQQKLRTLQDFEKEIDGDLRRAIEWDLKEARVGEPRRYIRLPRRTELQTFRRRPLAQIKLSPDER